MNTELAKALKARLHAKNNKDKKPHHDFPTPAGLADNMAESLDAWRGMDILEPSCGEGNLINAILRWLDSQNAKNNEMGIDLLDIRIDGIEIDEINVAIASEITHPHATVSVTHASFLEWQTDKRYDRILMNPPFNGQEYVKHIEKALSLLKDNGKLIAIVPTMALRNDRFRAAIGDHWQQIYETEPGEFAESGAPKSMTTYVVEIDKTGGSRTPQYGWPTYNSWHFTSCLNSQQYDAIYKLANDREVTREAFAKAVRQEANELIRGAQGYGNRQSEPILLAFWMTDEECNAIRDHFAEAEDEAPAAIITETGETQYVLPTLAEELPLTQLALFA